LPFLVLLAVGGLCVLAAPGGARADDGEDDDDPDVRVERPCTGRSAVRLRVREADDDQLRVDLTVRTERRGATWSIVVVHERRLVGRARSRTSWSSGSFSRRFMVADWPGRDTIVVRALGPRGEVCRAVATLRDDSHD